MLEKPHVPSSRPSKMTRKRDPNPNLSPQILLPLCKSITIGSPNTLVRFSHFKSPQSSECCKLLFYPILIFRVLLIDSQVARMLVGGMKVIGIYIWVSDSVFKNSTIMLSQVLFFFIIQIFLYLCSYIFS
jgi:hypothetical protein